MMAAMSTQKSYYDILGITPGATAGEIKRAFYRLSKRYHPDISPSTADLFKLINEAYQTLSDPASRLEYDRQMNATDYMDSDTDNADYSDDYTSAPGPEPEPEAHSYYAPIYDEPVINILADFSKYKFETAIDAIWRRNVFVLLGNAILCLTAFLAIIINRLVRLIMRRRDKPFPTTDSKNPWVQWLYTTIAENKLYPLCIWWPFMTGIFLAKVTYHIAKAVWWICVHILKPLLIGLALLIALSMLSSDKKR